MVSINLLKEPRRSERQARRRPMVELLVGVVVLAAVVAGWAWVAVDGGHAIQRLEQDMRHKQRRLASLTERRDLALARREQRNAVAAEHEALTALTRGFDRPMHLLSVISRVVDPLDVWLRRLRATDEKVTLSGVALSHEGILKLAERLEDADHLGPVNVFAIKPHAAWPERFQFSMDVFMDVADHG